MCQGDRINENPELPLSLLRWLVTNTLAPAGAPANAYCPSIPFHPCDGIRASMARPSLNSHHRTQCHSLDEATTPCAIACSARCCPPRPDDSYQNSRGTFTPSPGTCNRPLCRPCSAAEIGALHHVQRHVRKIKKERRIALSCLLLRRLAMWYACR